jgi:hypothetical protein
LVQSERESDLVRSGFVEYRDSDLTTSVDLSAQASSSLLRNIIAALPYVDMKLSLSTSNGGK